MLFRYIALTTTGKKLTGIIDADSYELAKERLLRDQVLVTQLSQLKKGRAEIKLPPSVLLAFTRELSQLLKAGLPLYESLLTVEEKHRHSRFHSLFLDLCDRLKSGLSLSSSLSKYPKTFDAIYLALVKAGEESGALSQIFEQLAGLIAKQQKLKKELVSALTYPTILFGFCFLVIIGLIFFVIPSLQELFEGRAVQGLTRAVLAISAFANAHVFPLASLFFALMGGCVYFFRAERGKMLLQKLFTKIPLLKNFSIHSSLIRFCRASHMLIAGGVPLLDALALSRKAMKHVLLEDVMEKAEKMIMEGKPLSSELKASSLIPPLMSRMLSISEETGKMGEMMLSIAQIYEEDMERNISQFTALLQPTLLLLLGTIVGVVVLSILLPLTDVSSFL